MPKLFNQQPVGLLSSRGIPFDYQNPSHIAIISQHIERFNQAKKILLAVDNRILIGIIVGSAGWVVSSVLPTATPSIIGFCFATYCVAKRSTYFECYKDTLNDLIAVYRWSMGVETGNHWYKLAIKEIQTLITTLGPWVSSQTLCTWSEEALKPGAVESLTSTRRKDISNEFELAFKQFTSGKHMVSWEYRLYGENSKDDLIDCIQSYGTEKVKEVMHFSFNRS